MDYSTSIVLDERRAKHNGLFPVKLRVYHISQKKAKLYSTIFDMSKDEFNSVWGTIKPRKEHKEKRKKIQAVINKAEAAAESIKTFSFAEFEKRFLQKAGDNTNIIYHYQQIINSLKAENRFNTASNYELSLKSFKEYSFFKKGKEPLKISFIEINADWLQKYENYMLNDLQRSRTTVSMYVRTLRTVFNKAISNNDIDADLYPFGNEIKGRYSPPSVAKVKKALPKADLKKLFDAKAQTPEQQKAKDFWFFSYSCNGINIKDIAQLQYKDLKEDAFVFMRAKTINTSKKKIKEVRVYLTDFSKGIIEKYCTPQISKNDYVFPIISSNDRPEIKYKKIKNFTKFINQNLKKLADNNGITNDISTYWARHSFVTSAVRSGASMEFVSEALSHNNLKTTQDYFAGFEDEQKKEIMEKLMIF